MFRGEDAARQRDAEIAALPMVEWKGKTLYTIRCRGTSGKGPHLVHLPPGHLYALIDLRWHLCPYHVNDVVEERIADESIH